MYRIKKIYVFNSDTIRNILYEQGLAWRENIFLIENIWPNLVWGFLSIQKNPSISKTGQSFATRLISAPWNAGSKARIYRLYNAGFSMFDTYA